MKGITCCAIYARVSTTGQRDQHTIKSQHEVLSAYADSQGWDTVETFTDDGKSGESIEGRPAFERLLQNAIEGRFDVVLVVDLDRLTRSSQSAESGLIYDILRKYEVKIATPTHLIDLENDEQGLLAGISREFSKYEKPKIRVRTQRGKLSKLREGKLADGSVPFGYRRVADPSSSKDIEAAFGSVLEKPLESGSPLDALPGLAVVRKRHNMRSCPPTPTARAGTQ